VRRFASSTGSAVAASIGWVLDLTSDTDCARDRPRGARDGSAACAVIGAVLLRRALDLPGCVSVGVFTTCSFGMPFVETFATFASTATLAGSGLTADVMTFGCCGFTLKPGSVAGLAGSVGVGWRRRNGTTSAFTG